MRDRRYSDWLWVRRGGDERSHGGMLPYEIVRAQVKPTCRRVTGTPFGLCSDDRSDFFGCHLHDYG